MYPAGARILRPLATVATLALAVVALPALAGCGGSDTPAPTPAQRLVQPGSNWTGMSTEDQRAVLRACRLDAAIGAAMGGATAGPGSSAPAVPRSNAFRAVLHLPTADLRAALDQRFADPAHATERLGDGCRQAVEREIARAGIGSAPRADFAPPVTLTGEGLRLTVEGDRATIPARLTPSPGARLAVTSAPGRAPTSARVTVTQHGAGATVRLTNTPRGTSYLRATVRARGATWHRLVTVTGEPAADQLPPRTFAPMVLHGEGPRGFAVVYVPRDARATATTDGSALTLTAGRTILLAQPLGGSASRTATPIPAGRYEHVRVRAHGEWAIRIVPAT